MKYFFDTEFIEGSQKTWWGGKTKPTIELISIGIVDEAGREYYAVSKDFNLKEAWNRFDLNEGSGDQKNTPPVKVYWLRENVLKKIFKGWQEMSSLNASYEFNYENFKGFLSCYSKTNNHIAGEIKQFCSTSTPPEFYGYYSDYDWVVFCWLFGRMIDLPDGFPMYCRDLKQTMDEAIRMWSPGADFSKPDIYKMFKHLDGFPAEPANAHNALADAQWTRSLHEFLFHPQKSKIWNS